MQARLSLVGCVCKLMPILNEDSLSRGQWTGLGV